MSKLADKLGTNWTQRTFQNGIRAASVGLYNDIIENTDSMKQYIRSETVEAITDIWKGAKPYAQDFLEDLRWVSLYNILTSGCGVMTAVSNTTTFERNGLKLNRHQHIFCVLRESKVGKPLHSSL